MIYDIIDNIGTYKGISPDIFIGLKWLSELSHDVESGVYELNARVKAIVSEYITKAINDNGYEAHRKFIDIHYLISGEEILCSLPLEFLKEIKPYNKDCDSSFFEETDIKPQDLLLGNGFFAIFFPQDGHMPQLCVNEPKAVKKVVIKVRIGE